MPAPASALPSAMVSLFRLSFIPELTANTPPLLLPLMITGCPLPSIVVSAVIAIGNVKTIVPLQLKVTRPPPLSADAVKFADGTPATVPQMAHDVVTFLSWAAEPSLEERHRVGFKVILFLVVATGVFYAAKRKIWSRIRH